MNSSVRLQAALKPQLDFWRRQLEGIAAPLELPADRLRPSGPLLRRAEEHLRLSEGLLDALELVGRRHGTDLPLTLLAGFLALLHRYTGRDDLVVGSPVAAGAGLLPLRVDAGGDPSFAELLGRTVEAVRSASAHQELTLEELAAELEPDPDPSRHPLFQIAFLPGANLNGDGLDLELGLVRCEAGPALAASYASDLFEAATVRRLLGHLLNLLEGVAGEADGIRVSELPLLGPEEREQVLVTWNGAEAELPEAPVHELAMECARTRPEALAVSWSGGSMTYGELLRRSLGLASWLQERGIGNESLVALSVERSPELVVSSLGVLLSGAAYLPVDPSNPPERLGYVLRDSGASLLLTQERLRLPRLELEQVSLDSLELDADRLPPVLPQPDPDRLAYVIYTSGSTGLPKGTDLVHRGLSNTIAHYRRKYLAPSGERMALIASPGFDASVWEIWMALTTGSSLHVAPAEILASPPDLLAWYAREGIQQSFAAPVQVEAMLAEAMPPGLALRRILAGGDRLRLRPRPDCPFTLVNNYGPTEVSIVTTEGPVSGNGDRQPSIGRPLDNVRVYLLDTALQPVPPGVPGELFIGGEGLARGYRGRPDLTADRFIPDPFGPAGSRLYRSGDLARWLPSGEIDFVGRADHQVKLRGFRIELGEIESVLLGHPAVREAAVLLRSAEGRLAAYVALVPGAAEGIPELREHLASRLPEYMVPTAWAVLGSLPLSASGKVDRRALERVPTEAIAEGEEGPAAPRTQLEELLADLFAGVLEIGQGGAGIHQDFFQLGGHSILATRLAARVRELCGVEIGLRAVFEHPTVASLASWIERRQAGDDGRNEIPFLPVPQGPVPLSSAQQRLWFLERLRPGTALYNLAQLFDLNGELSVPALAAAFDAVIHRQEALRTLFAPGSEGGDPVQLVCPEPLQRETLPVVDLGALPEPVRQAEAERITGEEARRPYDLERGPLLRTALLRLGPTQHRLVVGTHHIVSDAWSVVVLLRELSALYRAALAGQVSSLPPLPVRYPEFAVWQLRRLTDDLVQGQLAWWREHLAGVPTALELPADRLRPSVPSLRGERLRLPLGSDLEPALAALGRGQGATLFMTLLAAFQALLHRYTLQEDFVVGSPVEGRGRLELEPLIGFFVNMLPLRAGTSESMAFSDLLARVRESVLSGFAHQDLPFDRLVEELAPQRDLSRTPLFQVAFALQEAMAGPDLPKIEVMAAAEVDTGVSKFDLTLLMERGPHYLDAITEYSSDLFDRSSVQRMLGSFRVLLAGALAAPATPLAELPLLAEADREQVVFGWNRTAAEVPETPVHRLFELQAAAHPGALAAVSAEEALTYGELERRANLLAWRLRRLGVGPEDLVALLLERSTHLVLGALGTLKAGGAYLPIDPSYPADRVLYILRDAGVKALLTTSRTVAGLPEVPLHTGRMVLLDAGEETTDDGQSPPPVHVDPDGLAYVIYTSGSTGEPKGTELHHRGLSNHVAWHGQAHGLTAADRASLIAGPAFDASVFEMWPPLVAGASLHVPPPDVLLSPAATLFWLADRGVTVAFLPTPLAQALLPEPMPANLALRVLNAGGDRLQQRPPADLGFPLINHYGPTECTIVTTISRVAAEGHRAPDIGLPILNFRVHLLDRGLVPVPVGVPGELCVAGIGLARGYRRRPDLTAEKFVPDPLGGHGERLYRTGDLARRLPGGEIDFIGRLDQQVKIRGYRIELGEIEAAMRRHPAVRDAAALVREDEKRLVGCVVLHEGGELLEAGAPEALRAFLTGTLPEVMIPSSWVFLEALPLTPNGKVDRRALARMAPAPETHATVAPPRTRTEEAVAAVWSALLGVEGIGAFDDFFALGGHSLLAARLSARIQEKLGVELPLRIVFQEPTVARLAAWIEAEQHRGEMAAGPSLAAGVAVAPLSFAQQRLWLLDRIEPGSTAYNMPVLLHVSGSLRPAVLAQALAEVVRRHAALRTTFEVPEGAEEPVQVVHPLAGCDLTVLDLSALPDTETEAARLVAGESFRPFDLRRGPLLRAALLRLGADDHRLLVTMHHIVSDGWSVEVLLRELGTLYPAFAEGRPSPLPELPVQYPDFSVWQRSWLVGEELERQLGYWRGRLGGLAAPQVLELPADRPRPAVWSYRGAAYQEELARDLTARFEQLGKSRGATAFMAFLSAFLVQLHRYTAQEDLVVGAPLAGRGRPEIAGLIGFFVNSMALRVSLAGDPTFAELLARVREAVLGAQAHQDLPFEKLVAELVPGRDLSRNPLFQVMLAFQSHPPEERIAEGLTMKLVPTRSARAKFDLTLGVQIDGKRTVLDLEYSTDLFDATTMQRFVQHFFRLLEGIVEAPERRASELPLLTKGETQQLVEWNDTAAAFPEGLCLHELIEAQVERTPNRPAVTCDGRSLTYRELNEVADRLAQRLRAEEVGSESIVGVLAERSLEMVVGLLAVLKAGGAYLPLDPDHPSDRLALMLADSSACLVLAQERLLDRLMAPAVPILPLDGAAEPGREMARPTPRPEVHPDALAYVIYTSGSTGLPKGTLVSHRAIVNHMLWMQSELPLGSSDRVLQKTALSFDASVWEFWAPLMAGSLLVVALPGEQRDPAALVRRIREDAVTVLQVVPSLLGALLEVGGFAECRSLRRVYCGGEALSADLVADFFRVSQAELHNLYGPTEAAVDATSWKCERTGRRGGVPIGRPVSNLRVHVVDRWLRTVPIGIAGELLIGGVQLGRGYLARPDLTAERFMPDPFSGKAGARLYRTGDLVRRLPDGTVDFLGRIDHQVKLRGLRIELGEIEAALCRHPDVSRAVVLALEERIGAFYVPARESAPGAPDLVAALRRELPEYMVPAWFVALPALPLTSNGKIDRRALAGMAPAAPESASKVAPRTPMEKELAGIWSALLGVEEVGAHDDFFALGGHSLLAARMTTRVQERLGVELPLRVVLQEPTVSRLADWIEAARRCGVSTGPSLVAGLAGEVAPLSFAQQRLWFFEQLQPGSPAYNIPMPFRLDGPLRPDLLAAALAEVILRHGALRTTFERPEGTAEPVQVVHPAAGWELPVIDLALLPPDLRDAEAGRLAAEDSRRPFDLRRFPLLRTTLLRLGKDEHRLLATMHHIVSDGWSMEILENELGALYGALAAGRPSPLPELPVQYGDYAVWQRSWLAGQELERQLTYWRHRLAEAPLLELATDHPRPAVWSQRGAVETASLPGELADRVEQLGRRSGATPFMTLLAAFFALLQRYTAQDDLVLGTPLAGRGRPEVQDLIGFFVNTLALRVSLAGDLTFEELLPRVRETVLEAQDHQDVPFEKLVAELVSAPDLSRNPLFQVVFGMQQRLEPVRIGADLVLSTGEWAHHGTSKFDLTLHAQRTERSLELGVEYGTDLFDAATIRRMLGHFRRLLEGIVGEGAGRLSELPLLDEAEREQVLAAWNQTTDEVPDEPVHRLALRWAEVTPDAVAVSWDGGSLTYSGLARRAAELAGRLRSQGVGPETVVALRLERSAELVIAALAVLEAGGAYLPIDPAHPQERAEWIVRDSRAALLLTKEDLDAPAVTLPRFAGEAEHPHPDSLAYVIYTSGSTGTPKGTELRHRGLSNFIAWHRRTFDLGPNDRTSMVAGPGFDASVWEIWVALTSGASLHVPSREVLLSPADFLAWVAEKRITTLFLATPLGEALLAELESHPTSLALRHLLTGGDRLRRRPAPDLPFALINCYGPTETTIVVTAGPVAPTGERAPDIGTPVANTRLYILDRWLQPVPVGVTGEICLAGEGLARCYRDRPELTARAFVPDPFADGQRLYRTGDLARRLPSGTIEFLGRADHQVKIRGQRIELGEIEIVLGRHPAVRDCVLLVRDGRLVAYVVAREAVTVESLRAWLAKSLTEAMIPAAWAFLDAMPLTPNGKVDRRALPAPAAALDEESFVPPATATQRALARVWGALLGVERVGARDNFFHLGGHSLSATQMTSRVHERFGINLELRAVFENPTLEDLAAHIDGLRTRSQGDAEREGMYPLSFAQQRLWFLDRLQPGSPAYSIPALLRFEGPVQPALIAAALAEVVRRHAALRTTFELSAETGDPVQVVHRPSGWSLPVIDLVNLAEEARAAEAGRLMKAEAVRPFDLARGPLLRTTLLRHSQEENLLLATMHHIVADGWSQELLVRELGALHGAFAEGRPSPLPELPMQYPDFADWQRSWLAGGELERQLAWWRDRLASPTAFELPLDRPRPAIWSYRGDVLKMDLPETLAVRLDRLGQSQQATPFMTLVSGFLALLYRYAGQEDLLVGTPVAGRSRADVEGLIGFFVNMLPLRVDLDGEPSFFDLLGRVRQTALAAYGYQDIPFERLVAEIAPERNLSRHPLFQVIFAYLEGGERVPAGPGLTVTWSEGAHSGTSKFDLSFHVSRTAGRLQLGLEYSTDLFDRATIQRLGRHFGQLLEEAVAHPEMPLASLPLLDEAERAQIVAWEEAGRRRHPEGLLHGLFEAQAQSTPEAVALVAGSVVLTYAELDERSARLAERLRALGAGPEVGVAVCLERTAELVLSLLAVLRSGSFYVPLDPRYPAERLRFLLEDSGAGIVVTQSRLAADRLPLTLRYLLLDRPEPAVAGDAEPPPAEVTPGNLAYLIYTSGSTGRPKAVAIEHRSAVELAHWAREAFSPQELRGVLASTAFTFDLSVFELFVTLAWGGTVVLVENALAEPPTGVEVTLINTVPSAISELLRNGRLPASVRTINLAGEALPRGVADQVYARPETVRLCNLYGPSEDTTYSTWTVVERASERPPSIGRPIHNTRAYVLDRRLERLPIGVPGELFLAGAGLARGYLGRPELTAERFIPDPLSSEPGARMYRTGDLVRLRVEDELEYLGRLDHQVKVRGYRIELGEVETALARQPGVESAVVLAREDEPGDKRLVAYLLTPGGQVSASDLRHALSQALPEPMLPAAFVFLEAFPLTAHGKIDRRALPAPDVAHPAAAAEFVPPRTTLEEEVAQIWAEVLRVERVGANDSFWDLGGHSLLATRVLARLEASFGVTLPLRTLFAAPTLAGFASVVAESVLASQGEEEIDEALAALDDMTEEEVRALIEQTVRELEELA